MCNTSFQPQVHWTSPQEEVGWEPLTLPLIAGYSIKIAIQTSVILRGAAALIAPGRGRAAGGQRREAEAARPGGGGAASRPLAAPVRPRRGAAAEPPPHFRARRGRGAPRRAEPIRGLRVAAPPPGRGGERAAVRGGQPLALRWRRLGRPGGAGTQRLPIAPPPLLPTASGSSQSF